MIVMLEEPEAWSLMMLVSAVAAAVKKGADIIVFPEQFSGGRSLEGILSEVGDAAGKGRLVVLGNAPHHESGWNYNVSRAYILSGGAWQVMDKLDPTPAERAQKPPVKPGVRLPLFRFRGAVVAALPGYSIEKPEIAVSLKKRGVQLILISSRGEDEQDAARIERCAAARAVELGAAVVVVPTSPALPTLHLPVQRGFDLKPSQPAGREFALPWRKLLDLRSGSGSGPFLEPTPYYQVEI